MRILRSSENSNIDSTYKKCTTFFPIIFPLIHLVKAIVSLNRLLKELRAEWDGMHILRNKMSHSEVDEYLLRKDIPTMEQGKLPNTFNLNL